MTKLLSQSAGAMILATAAFILNPEQSTAGGSGSLFSTEAGLFGAAAMPAAAAIRLQETTRSPLLYANSDPVKIQIDAEVQVEELHVAAHSQPAQQVAARDLECMAEALYHEARGEGIKGQQAVAEVILNRVDSRAFPASVCGVINQPSQFSYTIGGAKPIRNKAAYQRARAIAQEALSGVSHNLTGGATYFHTPAVRPSWSRRFQRTTQIGRHIFYRDHTRIASN